MREQSPKRSIFQELASEIDRCAKCGTCLSVCPVFKELNKESAFARGKLACLEAGAAGELEFSKATAEVLSRCVLCGSCQASCPSGVRYVDTLLKSRRFCSKSNLLKTILLKSLLPDERLPSFMRAGRKMQRLVAPTVLSDGMRKPFTRLPYFGKGRYMPAIPERFLLKDGGSVHPARNETINVGYFVGCVTNYLLPQIGESVIALLRERGVTVTVPGEQGCCGFPDASGGYPEITEALIERNTRIFREAGVRKIVTACASCGGFLKEYYSFRGNDGQPIEVRDVSELLGELYAPRDFAIVEDVPRLTYHDPCHLRKIQKISREPREVIRFAAGERFTEMEEADSCCGFGGTFSLLHPDISLRINDRKIDHIQESGAGLLLTSCPGCILFLKEGIARHGLVLPVRHVVEFMHERLVSKNWEKPETHSRTVML